MAEIVGPAAAIVGLINIIGKAAFMGHGYREKVKGASKQIKKLADELDSLKIVLISLQDYIGQDPDSSQTLRGLEPSLISCKEDVQLLITKLEKPQSGWRWFFRRLKWPLDEADTQQTIEVLDRLKNTFSLALNADHISMTRRIELNTKGMNNSRRMEQRRVVLGWIYARHFYKKHRQIIDRRHPGTGMWILRDTGFMKWFSDTDFQILWGHGIPGVGKTFLSSVVIEHIEGHPQLKASRYGLAYIYFDFKEQDQQTPILVLASLVKQLASQIHSLPVEIEHLYNTLEPTGRTPSFDDFYRILLVAKNAFSRVYLIFDAIDECAEENQRKEILQLCHKMAQDGMKLFVTSRPHASNIQESFKYVAKIKLKAEKEDIESYVKQKINENLRSRLFVSRVKNKVISDLVECSQRIFLLARFNVEYICQQTSTENILDAVDLLRRSWSKSRPLNAAYERFMKRIQRLEEQIRTDIALKVLTLIVRARRPLTIIELQNEVFADHRLRKIGVLDERTLLDVCANLVFVDDTRRKHVRLIHYSAQEYLLEYPLLNIASSNVSSPNTTPYNTGLPDITPSRITPQPQGYRIFRPGVQEYYSNSEYGASDDSDRETETTHDSGIEIPDSPRFSYSHVRVNADRVREDDETTVTTDVIYKQMKECEEVINRADEDLRKHRVRLYQKMIKKLKNAELPNGADSTDAHSRRKLARREKTRESKEGERQGREREAKEKEREREQKVREKERQAREREAKEKERQEREQKEKEKERQERDRKIREREQQERDRLARQNERQAREREAKERERQERDRKAREMEQQMQDRAAQMREREAMERERQERERKVRERERQEREQEARENIRLVRELEAKERERQEREQEERENVRLVRELLDRERKRQEQEQEERENVHLVRELEERERARQEREQERENGRRVVEQEKRAQDKAKTTRRIQKKRGLRD